MEPYNIKLLIIGIVLSFFGQIISFFVLNGQFLYAGWKQHAIILMIIFSIPSNLLFLQASKDLFIGTNENLYLVRFLTQFIGFILFPFLTYILFGEEPFTMKNGLSLLLMFGILLVQLFL